MSSRSEVVDFISALRRQDLMVSALSGATVGLSTGTVLGTLSGLIVGLDGAQERIIIAGGVGALGGAVAGAVVASVKNTVADVEHRVPGLRNLLITASELLAPNKTTRDVSELVFFRAAEQIRQISPAAVFPARASFLALVIAVVTWAGVMTFTASQDPNARITL